MSNILPSPAGSFTAEFRLPGSDRWESIPGRALPEAEALERLAKLTANLPGEYRLVPAKAVAS